MGVKGLKNSRTDSKVDQLEHLPTSKIHFGCESELFLLVSWTVLKRKITLFLCFKRPSLFNRLSSSFGSVLKLLGP